MSTSAASTPKRKFGEMRQADSPAAWKPQSCSLDEVGVDKNVGVSHAPLVPRLQLPQPEAESTPTDRYLSPPLHVPCAITDFALQKDYDAEMSPRAMGRYGNHFEPSNSVDSDDLLVPESASTSRPISEPMHSEEQVGDENVPPAQSQQVASHCSPGMCFGAPAGSTPAPMQESSESSYESPPSLLPPQSGNLTSQRKALVGSAAGSECTVEMGSCSPIGICNPPTSCILPDGGDIDEDVHDSPCMRASVAFAPEQTHPQIWGSEGRAILDSVESSGGSADSIDGGSDCRPGNSCMESSPSHEHCGSPQTSGSTVYSSFYSHSAENFCPNAFPSIPDTPSSKATSDVGEGQQEAFDADGLAQTRPELRVQQCPKGTCTIQVQASRQSDSDCQAGSQQPTYNFLPNTRQSCCAMPLQEGDTLCSDMMSQQAAESLSSDEINVWKSKNCIPSLTEGNQDDSLVILTNKILRAAFRAQRRAEMQKSLRSGGSYAAPRRFLSTPLDPTVLDALAVPVAVRASEICESVENVVNATLPRTLRLSHCFAAWRYIMCEPRQVAGCACTASEVCSEIP